MGPVYTPDGRRALRSRASPPRTLKLAISALPRTSRPTVLTTFSDGRSRFLCTDGAAKHGQHTVGRRRIWRGRRCAARCGTCSVAAAASGGKCHVLATGGNHEPASQPPEPAMAALAKMAGDLCLGACGAAASAPPPTDPDLFGEGLISTATSSYVCSNRCCPARACG